MRKNSNKIKYIQNTPRRQCGAVLLVMLVVLILGGSAILLNSLNSTAPRLARDKVTADALAQAKEALIGFAVKVQISKSDSTNQPRPGDLPCPDTNNDGSADSPCNTQALGRLPWKTLGLPKLRDGSGETLWYAVSTNFQNNTRTGALNSDTPGTISVFSAEGVLIHDGGGSTGAVAVILAPGEVLTRQDSSTPQNRSCTIGVDCDDQERCTAPPPALTPKCDPKNYLDIPIPAAGLNPKDNDKFTDGSSSDGFIQGNIKVYDPVAKTHQVILNDQLLVVTQANIMQGIQKRVAAEVRNCLSEYAQSNNGRFPWAAPITDLGTTYNDGDNVLFGRIPDNLSNTDSGTSMDNKWKVSCKTHDDNQPSTWWKNWKEQVFYGLADKFKPQNSVAPDFPSICATAGNCISINNSGTPAKFIVIVAGKKLANPDQSLRDANKTNAFYYLEGGNQSANQTGAYTFTQGSTSESYNDTVVYQ
jgi:hypothetical protein